MITSVFGFGQEEVIKIVPPSNDSIEVIKLPPRDVISPPLIFKFSKKDDDIIYLSKLTNRKNTDGSAVRTVYAVGIGTQLYYPRDRFSYPFKDFPELKAMLEECYISSGIELMDNAIKCYNFYMTSGIKQPIADDDFFRSYGLITKKEAKSGPPEYLLKKKLPILANGQKYIFYNQNFRNGVDYVAQSESLRTWFYYGQFGPYKTGPLLKNLSRITGKNEYIKKYRNKFWLRTSFFLSGFATLGLAIHSIANGYDSNWYILPLAAYSVISINFPALSPQKYKEKYISAAVVEYNKSLRF